MESGRLKQLGKGYTSTTPDPLLAQGLRINRAVHHRHSGECRNPENVSVMLRYSVNSAS
jgi:hypothetical protein